MPRLTPLPFAVLLFAAGCDSEPSVPQLVGTLEWDRVELIAEASEPIVELLVREGEQVEPGRPLLQFDPERRLARLNEARAAREQAAARLLELKRGPRVEDIRQAEARLRGAEQVQEARGREYERLAELLKRKLASPDTVDRARSDADAAKAERDTALAALQELRAGTRVEQVEQARQSLAQAEAAERRYDVDLARLIVRAPVPGRVDSLPLKPGNQPQTGKVVAVLLSGAGPYARVYIPEPVRVRVQPGDPARIHVDGLPQPFDGVVRTVDADPVFTPFFALTERDRKHLSYVAKIDLKGEVHRLPAGVPVQVDLPQLSDALTPTLSPRERESP
jgi:HlyD family secretion protein